MLSQPVCKGVPFCKAVSLNAAPAVLVAVGQFRRPLQTGLARACLGFLRSLESAGYSAVRLVHRSMLELHQFRHSAFCLKVRMVLQFKGLTYREIEVTPGLGQFAVFRLSGQRQVPVLVEGDEVVADSSAISRYLERQQPDPALIPTDPQQAAQAHLIEDWADTTLARVARTCLVQAATIDPGLLMALLPGDVPEPVRQAMGAVPGGWLNGLTDVLSHGERAELLSSLEKIAELLETSQWLVGEAISLADLAVAAQLSLLRFPPSAGAELAGKGVPGLSDHPRLQPLFDWCEKLDLSLFRPVGSRSTPETAA